MDITNKIKYIVDDQNNKIAVQMDIDVYEAIENIVEDYGLAKAIEEAQGEEYLDLNQAILELKKINQKS